MKKLKKLSFALSILSILTFFTPANAELKVVTSIKPIHSLASYLMDGIGKPELIVDGYASPHGFSMKPSHAKMLQNADLIFWVGEDLENFLEKPLSSIAKKAEKIELMDIKGLNVLSFRERNIFDEHDDHDDHEGHAKKKKDDHDDHDDHDGHTKKKKDDHDDHDDHEGHGHVEYDPHIWLDPINAKVILSEITEHLIENDSKNASTYESNLAKALAEIDKLMIDVITETNTDLNYVVFHDAYHYYENRFNVNILGAMTVNPDVMPGAEQIHEMNEVIEHDNVSCILSEPQFNPDIIKSIAKDTNVKTGVLDPLGANLKPGKDLYFDLIRNMSASFNC